MSHIEKSIDKKGKTIKKGSFLRTKGKR